MKQEEIFQYVVDERKKQGINREELEHLAGTVVYGKMQEIAHGTRTKGSVMVDNLIKTLDVLGLQIVIEDKDANWGLDMRLRRMPRKLYTGQRIESREMIRKEGLHKRVDLFDSPETALKFISKPCDVYEVLPSGILRKFIEVNDHEFGTMYSYQENISPDVIENRVTYR